MSSDAGIRFFHSVGSLPGWLGRHVPSRQLLLILAFVTGLAAGAGAFLLKRMIAWVSDWFTDRLAVSHANWELLLLPVVGILLAALFQRYIIRREIYHGVDRLNADLCGKKYVLPFSQMFTPMIASSVTLGFGGSAGSEGPIAYAGAAMGSNVGKCFGVPTDMMRVLVACGAAAGIAGIFKAPIGGAFFALECLYVELASVAIIALIVAAVTAGLTAYLLSGCTPDIYFSSSVPFDMHWLPWVIAAGLFFGLYSVYYQLVMTRMARFYALMRNHWQKNIMAGAIIGAAIFLFPPLYGEGYGVISDMLAEDMAALIPYGLFARDRVDTGLVLLLSGGMLLVKAFATVSTTSGGGVAGDFAPSLFTGCIAGCFFAFAVNTLPGIALPVGYFAFFGMAAVIAATQRAPLMAIFLTVEMGAAYTLLLPVTVVATVSYFVFRLGGRRFGISNPIRPSDQNE